MTAPEIKVSAVGKSDLGRTRDHNEDTFLVADLATNTVSFESSLTDHDISTRGVLFLVADGMGGAAAGELASEMAANLIFDHLTKSWAAEDDPTPERFTFRLREAVELANDQIYAYARQHPEVRGMGTTATVAGVLGQHLYLAQVGDSRGYLVRDGVAVQLTKDQSLTQRLVDAGEMTEEEAEQSERRNIILQALGPDARIRVDLTFQALRRGDTLVICSDGLSGQVRREEIGQIVQETPDLNGLCDRLIELANGRGGPDNITAVVARFTGAGLPVADSEGEPAYRVYPTDDPRVTPVSTPAVIPPIAPAALERSGSPATMAGVVVGILLLLFLLFTILKR